MTTVEALALKCAFEHSLDHLENLNTRSVATTASRRELRERLGMPLADHGTSAETVINELVDATAGGQLGTASGRFFAYVIGGTLPSAIAADWLTSVWDNNAGIYAGGPAASVVEEVAGEWLKDVLDLPRDASFAFTTGCQLAHMTCLAAARHALLARLEWDVEADGLTGAPPIRVLANDQFHGTAARALRFLGIGTRAMVALPTGADGRLAPEQLATALPEYSGPTIVLLNAADLNVGAFDSFGELIPIAKAAGAWVHVDGAFGLWARASREHRHLTEGIELADSWATDAHKWLNTPQDNGLAFVRDRDSHRAAMTLTASYLHVGGGVRDEIDWTPEFTRRARGFAVYAALRELGRDGVADLVDRCCAFARALAEGIGKLPGAELIAMPTLNQGLVRFPEPGETSEESHDLRTDAIIARINATGEAYFSGTTWRGRRAMRISVCNWRTTQADIDRTLQAIRGVLEQG